jgi:hypothetical protein
VLTTFDMCHNVCSRRAGERTWYSSDGVPERYWLDLCKLVLHECFDYGHCTTTVAVSNGQQKLRPLHAVCAPACTTQKTP